MVSTLEQMQVPNGTGPGVRRSKRPLLASRTRGTEKFVAQYGKPVRNDNCFCLLHFGNLFLLIAKLQ